MEEKENLLKEREASGIALLPLLLFIVIYLGAGIILQSKGVAMAFYQFPSVVGHDHRCSCCLYYVSQDRHQ